MQGLGLGDFMAESQYHGEPSMENYAKGENKEDFEKNKLSSQQLIWSWIKQHLMG